MDSGALAKCDNTYDFRLMTKSSPFSRPDQWLFSGNKNSKRANHEWRLSVGRWNEMLTIRVSERTVFSLF